ncbi:MAG: TrmH family RNA methyltransferase [Nitriliruptoraceae bacterium]
MTPSYGDPVDAVRRAHGRPDMVVLEGVHALKHAVRFGAQIDLAVTPDRDEIEKLLAKLAPDVALPATTTVVNATQWESINTNRGVTSPIVALARRPNASLAAMLSSAGVIVALEAPRHLGNIGATVRVAAAAGAAGVLVMGGGDPWHPSAVRGGAGLQFAVPTMRIESLEPLMDHLAASPGRRSIVALDPAGEPLTAGMLDSNAIVTFGTERAGLTAEVTAAATRRIALPMRPGVSSLNLATAVAVTLYCGTRPDFSPAG